MLPWLTVDEVIERALLLISQHPLFKDPIVFNGTGNVVRINKLRTFDGFDLNELGITLSIFPYAYEGSSNETVTSNNAAMVFEPYNVGSGQEGFDRCKLALVVKISTTGLAPDNSAVRILPNNTRVPIIERQARERYLMQWLTILRAILLTKPIENLAGLVTNSTVNWGSFRSVRWDGEKGKNYVLHSAALLWQVEINMPRNWREYPNRFALPNSGSNPTWQYVGVRMLDEALIYWDSASGWLTGLAGFPIQATPQGLSVVWDPVQNRFERPKTGVPLTVAELVDPRRVPPGEWINTNLILVGLLLPMRLNLYWNKLTNQLQLFDGTIITQLADGTPIAWDPVTGFYNPVTGLPIVFPTDGSGAPLLIPGSGGAPAIPATLAPMSTKLKFNIFDVNGLELRDDFEI